MKKLFSLMIAFMMITTSMLPIMAQEEQSTAEDKARQLAELLVTEYEVTSLQYAIRDKGEIVLSDGAGFHDIASKQPITKDSMFGIGSVSKMHVTAATMMLVDENRVNLDTPLTTYIEDFTMADERYQEITPRMLMNHSSGLYGTHYNNSMLFADNDTRNRDELLTRLQSARLKSDPGAFSVYCNDGFQLLEILVERVSGLSYSEFLETQMNAPLQLVSTKTPLDDFDREQLAKTYFPTVEGTLPAENANVIGAGGIYSTAEELTKFAEMLIGQQSHLLSEASAEAMQQHEYRNGIWVSEESNSYNYGLGWDSVHLAPFDDYGITALTKGGDTMMYHAALTALPEHQISIAVLSSGGQSFYNTIFATNVLLAYLNERGIIEEIAPNPEFAAPVKVEMPSNMTQYSGLYASVNEMMNIEIIDGEMTLPPLIGGFIPAQTYVYTGGGQFTSPDGRVVFSFDEQVNGQTYLKLNTSLEFPGIGESTIVYHQAQKLEKNSLDPDVKQAWEARDGKSYFALDEKITSMMYLMTEMINKQISVQLDAGYANGTKIIDGNRTINVIEIPSMNGRDTFDLNFYHDGSVEYLMIDGFTYISELAIQPIFGGRSSISTIQPEGHARWYTIDENSANKTMTVEIPHGGGFVVYDDMGFAIYLSVVTNGNSVVLPENGLVVFGGEPGDVFHIRIE